MVGSKDRVSIGALISRNPALAAITVAQLVTKEDTLVSTLLLKLDLTEKPVQNAVAHALLPLIKTSDELAKKIFKAIPLKDYISLEDANDLFAWALAQADSCLIELIIEYKLPITPSLHEAWLVSTVKNDRQRGMKILRLLPKNSDLFRKSTPETTELLNLAWENFDEALIKWIIDRKVFCTQERWIELLFANPNRNPSACTKLLKNIPELKLRFPQKIITDKLIHALNGNKHEDVELILQLKLPLDYYKIHQFIFTKCNLSISDQEVVLNLFRLFVKHKDELFFEEFSYSSLYFIFNLGKYQLVKDIFPHLTYACLYEIINNALINYNLDLFKFIVNEKIISAENVEKIFANDDFSFLRQAFEEWWPVILSQFSNETLQTLVFLRDGRYYLDLLAKFFLATDLSFFISAIEQKQTLLVQGMLLLSVASNCQLPEMNQSQQSFVAQISWHDFDVDSIPQTQQEFDFFKNKRDLPYNNYQEYVMLHMNRTISGETESFVNKLIKCIQNHGLSLFLQGFYSRLDDNNINQLIPLNDKGHPTTYWGKFLFDTFKLDESRLPDLKEIINNVLKLHPPPPSPSSQNIILRFSS